MITVTMGKVIISINGNSTEVTVEEARDLLKQLKEHFEIHKPNPFIPYREKDHPLPSIAPYTGPEITPYFKHS
jgi:hypothetical protein